MTTIVQYEILVACPKHEECVSLARELGKHFRVETAATGSDALDLLRKSAKRFDLLMIDVDLPGMSGLDVMAVLRDDSGFRTMPIMLIADKKNTALIDQGYNLGAVDYLIRPLDTTLLTKRIFNLLSCITVNPLKTGALGADSRRHTHHQSLLDKIDGGIILFERRNTKWKPLYFNRKVAELHDITIHEDSDVTLFMMLRAVAAEDKDTLKSFFRRLHVHGEASCVYKLPGKGSLSSRWMRAYGAMYRRADEFTSYLVSIVDITAETLAQIKMHDAEVLLSSTINNVPVGLFIYRIENGRFVYVSSNDTAFKMFGYKRRDTLAIDFFNFERYIQPEAFKIFSQRIFNAVKTEGEAEHTSPVMTKKGPVWTLAKAKVYRDAQNNLFLYIVTIDVSQEKQYEQELRRLAEHDPLTEVYNRATFLQATRRLLESHSDLDFSLAVINIERFSVTNEIFGTAIGDELLKELAADIKNALQKYNVPYTLGRIGGDRFAFCLGLPGDVFLKPNSLLFQKLRIGFVSRRVPRPLVLKLGLYEVKDRNISVTQMCDRAELAVQTIRGNYSQIVAKYDEQLRASMLREQELAESMEAALKKGEFTFYLQPIYGVDSEHPESAEALVRWIHPTKGVILPGAFIPTFEKNGFITELDKYIWEQVCRYLAERKAEGKPLLPISVNISRQNMFDDSLCDYITNLTDRYGIEHKYFRIEITETYYHDAPEQFLNTLKQFRDAGFEIFMDDFGSGYSSFNSLQNIPINALKIDMRFITDIEHNERVGAILMTIMRMTRWLHIHVVAEGVENITQVKFLRSIGCNSIQGYYYRPPIPIEDFDRLLEESSPQFSQAKIQKFSTDDLNTVMDGNSFLSKFFDLLPVALVVVERFNNKLDILRSNSAFREFLDYDTFDRECTERIAQFSMIHTEDMPAFNDALDRAQKDLTDIRINVRVFTTKKRIIYAELLIHPLSSDELRPVYIISFTDDTENILNIEQQKQTISQLKNIVNGMNASIVVFDPDDNWRIIFANAIYHKLVGIKLDETQLKSFNTHIIDEDRESVAREIQALQTENERPPFYFRVREQKENRIIRFKCYAAKYVRSVEKTNAVLCILLDSTDEKQ